MSSTNQWNFAKAESPISAGEVQSASSSGPQAGTPRRSLGDPTPESLLSRDPDPLLTCTHADLGAGSGSSSSHSFSFFFTAINIKLAMLIHHSTDSISGFSVTTANST